MANMPVRCGLAILAIGLGNTPAEGMECREALVQEVARIGVPGIPGPVCVVGAGAFPVIVGRSGDQDAALVAAGAAGNGRLVAFGHDGYLQQEMLAAHDTGRLIRNAVRWSGRDRAPSTVVIGARDLADHLESRGFPVTRLQIAEAPDAPLDGAVVCLNAVQLRSARLLERLRAHLDQGGGVLVFATGWGWQQLNPGQALDRDFLGNALVAEAGLAFSGAMSQRGQPAGLPVDRQPEPWLHAARALEALHEASAGERVLSGEERQQIAATVTMAAEAVWHEEASFRPQLETLLDASTTSIVPSPDRPIRQHDALERLIVALQSTRLRQTPAGEVQAHPAAETFPGAVPHDAPRETRTLEIDTRIPRWHSTGLYAAPGDHLTVRVDESAAGRGLGIRIGVHTDSIRRRPDWWRFPEITRQFSLDQPEITIASAFGGLILVDVPRDRNLGTIPVVIEGAVAAPWYVHGTTDPDAWRETLRHLPAPWAEIGSDKVIISVPSRYVRQLDDPAELMDFWDSVLDACADLAARSRQRSRPERYVSDMQISAGYMHAGYPIMTFLDAAPRFVDVELLRRQGDWGMFHEMGHNHQSRDWTFTGTGEVTVNLFTLYVLERCSPGAPLHRAIRPQAKAQRIRRHILENQSDFEAWKRDPFTGLIMYIQLQQAFGWEAYQRVFAEYRDLPARQRPRTDAEKRDQWLVRMSRTVERNLGPFFETWGVPTSAAARQSIEDLPVWMPEGFPPTP